MPLISFNELKPAYDIVIVGGGAAGCFLALNLDSNFKVLVVDYRSFPRFKACSGIIVRHAHKLIEKLDLPESVFCKPKFLDLNYIDFDNGLEKRVKKGFFNTSREKFDEFLFKKVIKKNNVFFLEKTRFLEFNFIKHELITSILAKDNKTTSIVSKYLVGCDGAISSVRNSISNVKVKKYLAIQELIRQPKHNLKEAVFFFNSMLTDHYAWIIPKNEFVEIGIALTPYKSKEKYSFFKKFIEKEFGIKGKGKLSSALILRPNSLKEIVLGKKNVLLAGEAAGFITPTGAEGISNALNSAFFAAKVINSNSKNLLKEYSKNCKPLLERFKEKFKKLKKLKDKNKRKELFFE